MTTSHFSALIWRICPAVQELDALPAMQAGGRYQASDVADVAIAGLDAQEVTWCLVLLPEQRRLCIVLMDVAG